MINTRWENRAPVFTATDLHPVLLLSFRVPRVVGRAVDRFNAWRARRRARR